MQWCVADHPQTVPVDEQLQVRPAINTQQEVFQLAFRDYFVQPTQEIRDDQSKETTAAILTAKGSGRRAFEFETDLVDEQVGVRGQYSNKRI